MTRPREGSGGEGPGGQGHAIVKELVLTRSYELAALVNVSEQNAVLTQADVLEKIKRLRESPAKGR